MLIKRLSFFVLAFLILSFLISISLSGFVYANIQVYNFENVAQEERFNLLVQELRCPKCQNNNLADSNSELSTDLKTIIQEKIIAGEDNQQIVSYLTERYGDFITYRPPVKPSTWLIWFGPFVILFIGIFFIIRFLSRRKMASQFIPKDNSSQNSKAMLAQWSEEVAAGSGKNTKEIN